MTYGTNTFHERSVQSSSLSFSSVFPLSAGSGPPSWLHSPPSWYHSPTSWLQGPHSWLQGSPNWLKEDIHMGLHIHDRYCFYYRNLIAPTHFIKTCPKGNHLGYTMSTRRKISARPGPLKQQGGVNSTRHLTSTMCLME